MCMLVCGQKSFSQATLPEITVINLNGNVVVSWLNEYKKPIQNILIQRSFDSTKNFTTIGSVLTPQNLENGYPDRLPPYDRMYYRVMVGFEGGEYVFGPANRAIAPIKTLEPLDVTAIPVITEIKETKVEADELSISKHREKSNLTKRKNKDSLSLKTIQAEKINTITNLEPIHIIETAYPSLRVFTNKQNVVVVAVPQAIEKKCGLKVFGENQKLVFELKRIPDDYLMLEKSNFYHSGWFNFEVYVEGKLFEKNKFFVAKDKGKLN